MVVNQIIVHLILSFSPVTLESYRVHNRPAVKVLKTRVIDLAIIIKDLLLIVHRKTWVAYDRGHPCELKVLQSSELPLASEDRVKEVNISREHIVLLFLGDSVGELGRILVVDQTFYVSVNFTFALGDQAEDNALFVQNFSQEFGSSRDHLDVVLTLQVDSELRNNN
jgi:hypothetical protein